MRAATIHPAAEVFPLLSGPEFDELVADYADRGVHLYFVAGGYQFRSARESAGRPSSESSSRREIVGWGRSTSLQGLP